MFEATPITLDQVVSSAKDMQENGWRFVTQSVIDLGEPGFDVLYHYDKELEIKHFRLTVPKGTSIPSR